MISKCSFNLANRTEIQLLNNSPGIITKLQSPSDHAPTNLAAALAQAKLILPGDQKPSSLKATRHLSNSMKELATQTDEDLKGPADKAAGKPRRNSIRQWVAGATHRKKYSAACKQLKESLSRESSLERSDVHPTGAQQLHASKHPAKITSSSSLLPQFSLKDDSAMPATGAGDRPKERKRRMSTFTDWKPSFGGASGPFGLTGRPSAADALEAADRTKQAETKAAKDPATKKAPQVAQQAQQAEPQKVAQQTADKGIGESAIDRPVHLNKLDEEAEEEEENITELSSPQLSKRSSAVAIHEMKSSPGTSLSGVFYCSSSVQSISNRKSSLSIQTQGSSRMSINSTGDSVASHAAGSSAQATKLQRRSTLNVGQYSRQKQRVAGKEDKERYLHPNDLEPKPRSASSDLTLDTAFHSSFLNRHQAPASPVRLAAEDDSLSPSSLPTTSNYATTQPSPIVTQTIAEEIAQRSLVPLQHTAIDFHQPTDPVDTALPVEHTQLTANAIHPPAAVPTISTRTSSRHSSYASSRSSRHRSSTSRSGRSGGRHSSSNLGAPDEKSTRTAQDTATGPTDTGEPAAIRPRKFCKYFRWYDWMTKRDDRSLFIFHPDNRLRLKCIRVTEHKTFDYVVLIFISLNCITLAMERPKIPPWSTEREVLNAANYIFTFVFAVEMALKVIAKGLFYGDEAYFTSGWNCMDGLLVGVSLFDLTLSMIAQRSPRILGILRVFRLLRSLRPLR